MPVGIGIVGTNWGGKVQLPIFKAAGLDVVALYSRDKKKAQQMCEKSGVKYAFDSVEELCACPEVHVVSITSPTYLHAEHTLIALKAGKHVLADKPAGANVAEVEQMVKEAQQRPAQFAVMDHEMRYTSAAQAARKAIQVDGAIGQLRHFDFHQMLNFGHFGPNHVWWNEVEKGGGAIGGIGVHSIDMLHFITGQKATSISAMTETFLKEKPMHPKDRKTEEDAKKMLACTAEEYVAANFRCDKGAVGTLSLSAVVQGQSASTIVFNGTSGSAKLDLNKNTFTVYDAKGKVVSESPKEVVPEPLTAALGKGAGGAVSTYHLAVAMKSFVEGGSKEGLSIASSFEDALYNQKVIAAIHASSAASQQSKL